MLVCVWMCGMCVYVCASVCYEKQQGTHVELNGQLVLSLSIYSMGLRSSAQLIRLGARHLFLVDFLTCPYTLTFIVTAHATEQAAQVKVFCNKEFLTVYNDRW